MSDEPTMEEICAAIRDVISEEPSEEERKAAEWEALADDESEEPEPLMNEIYSSIGRIMHEPDASPTPQTECSRCKILSGELKIAKAQIVGMRAEINELRKHF